MILARATKARSRALGSSFRSITCGYLGKTFQPRLARASDDKIATSPADISRTNARTSTGRPVLGMHPAIADTARHSRGYNKSADCGVMPRTLVPYFPTKPNSAWLETTCSGRDRGGTVDRGRFIAIDRGPPGRNHRLGSETRSGRVCVATVPTNLPTSSTCATATSCHAASFWPRWLAGSTGKQ
jgi:hypothetical protein